MIAQLPVSAPATDYAAFLDALRAAGFRGQFSTDYGTRTVLATDNSIYQRLPRPQCSRWMPTMWRRSPR